jgi:hypothetical protein
MLRTGWWRLFDLAVVLSLVRAFCYPTTQCKVAVYILLKFSVALFSSVAESRIHKQLSLEVKQCD